MLRALAAILALAPLAAAAQEPAKFHSVSDQRLVSPEPGNWLMVRGNYQGWMYSPLEQINVGNVAELTPVWSIPTGVTASHQAPPLVNDGIMLVATPFNQVMAVDAKTGTVLWRHKRALPDGFWPLHNTSRGVALYGESVYFASLDAVLEALDARTGKVLWQAVVEDYLTGPYMTMAPLIVNGLVMVGVSGGEFGVRGFIQAFDADSGESVWKTYTIPGPGEPGHDTWTGDTWQHGGGTVWLTGTYDPETGLTFWGTDNGSPWAGDQRPGDNLYTASTIAIDPKDGRIVDYFQHQWNESWDWGEVDAPMVVDFTSGGQNVKGLIKAARNGYLYWLSRERTGIAFIKAVPYVSQNVFTSLDPITGRPSYDPARVPGTGKKAEFCPSQWGGKNWPYAAFNPLTRMIYIPSNDNHCGSLEFHKQERVAGKLYTGTDPSDIGFTADDEADYYGQIQAWSVDRGERVWDHKFETSLWAPLMSTAGGLIFAGGTDDRYFRAFDAATGELLWKYRTSSGILAPASSYMIDGVQYVAVVSGKDLEPSYTRRLLSEWLGWPAGEPSGGKIWAFALTR